MVCFQHQYHVTLFQSSILCNNFVEKNINIQQTLFFSFLKETKPTKQKKPLTQSFNNGANKNEAINVLGFKSICRITFSDISGIAF